MIRAILIAAFVTGAALVIGALICERQIRDLLAAYEDAR